MNAGVITGADCHAHIIDPARFPFVPGAGYQPLPHEVGTREDYWRALNAYGISHGLLVQPSCYAFDNRALLDAIARAPGHAKGIAVVPLDVSDAVLRELIAGGVVGVRLNLGAFDPGFLERAGARDFLRRMRDQDLFVQVYAHAPLWERIAPILDGSGVKLIVDHMGEPDLAPALSQPGFAAVLALGRGGRACVKISGPYRLSQQPAPYADVVPLARACVDAFGSERCLWGSDWPFIKTSAHVTYGEQCAWLEAAVPDAATRQRVLIANPRRLFGFGDAAADAA